MSQLIKGRPPDPPVWLDDHLLPEGCASSHQSNQVRAPLTSRHHLHSPTMWPIDPRRRRSVVSVEPLLDSGRSDHPAVWLALADVQVLCAFAADVADDDDSPVLLLGGPNDVRPPLERPLLSEDCILWRRAGPVHIDDDALIPAASEPVRAPVDAGIALPVVACHCRAFPDRAASAHPSWAGLQAHSTSSAGPPAASDIEGPSRYIDRWSRVGLCNPGRRPLQPRLRLVRFLNRERAGG